MSARGIGVSHAEPSEECQRMFENESTPDFEAWEVSYEMDR